MSITHKALALVLFTTAISFNIYAQPATSYDLEQLLDQKKLTIIHREANYDTKRSMKGIALSQDVDEGIAWINDVSFSTGTIEIDLKGQDVFQHSFVGIAFHAINDSAFEAIYFRPFQFRTDDGIRKNHAVQYINLPTNTWRQLRADHPGMYENIIEPAPDPDDWFHVKMVITETKVMVYVNGSAKPCLEVNSLSKIKKGRIGLYTADQSGGSFANLVVKSD
jgi:hypothetical protein